MPRIILILTLFALVSCTGQNNQKGREEILSLSQTYVSALQNQEIATLLSLWAEEGVYRNPLTGKLIRGKSRIKNEYLSLFKAVKEAKITVNIHAVSFPFPDKAIVEGEIALEDSKPLDLSILFLKQGEIWRILNVSEINFIE